MVLDDVFAPQSPPPKHESKPTPDLAPFEKRLASPQDRLASVVADLVIFLPILVLAIAPFRKQALEAQMSGQDSVWMSAVISSAALANLLILVYQTFFVTFFGGTPGKLALGLRVVSIWHRGTPRLMESFIRAFVWNLELLALGIPWLAVASNERRRPFHDRAADTVVVAVKHHRQAGVAKLSEMSIASGIQSAMLAVLTLTAAIHLVENQREQTTESWIQSEMEERGELCGEVREARQEWLLNEGKKKSDTSLSRLEVALALHAAGVLSEDCLRGEANYSIWRNGDSDQSYQKQLAYLAKGLSEEDDDSITEAYFKKACELGVKSDACRVVTLNQAFDDSVEIDSAEAKAQELERENQVLSVVDSIQPKSSIYLRIWVARHLMNERKFHRALQVMEALAPQSSVATFFASERAKAFWHVGEIAKSTSAMSSAIELGSHSERVDLSQWFCWNESIANGCSESAKLSCGLLNRAVSATHHWLKEDDVAAAYVRAVTCNESSAKKLDQISEEIANAKAKAYLKALVLLASEKSDTGLEVLKGLAAGSTGSGRFFIEANLKITDLAKTPDDLKLVNEKWQDLTPQDEGWKVLGTRLLDKFAVLQSWDASLKVGLKMLETELYDPELYKSMVVVSYRSGQLQMAEGFLDKWQSFQDLGVETSPAQARIPASLDGFDEILKSLAEKGQP